MPDVYVYVAEELPRPWRTTEFEGTFAVDYSGEKVAGIEILGAQRVTVDGVDILDWSKLLTQVLHELVVINDAPPSQVIHPSSFETGRDADRRENAWAAARALLGMD